MLSLFFFQAEDGIRDHCVTGVQTCALPISLVQVRSPTSLVMPDWSLQRVMCRNWLLASRSSSMILNSMPTLPAEDVKERSEERRVGKECRSRWSPYH